ncbi:MAG TPA: class I SAM-dependent rRNA methyltransferase [Planctomycetia bacterium]|nr:class I SAM-dependent rRNA methyltransferase [Planctomycetia bacterium]
MKRGEQGDATGRPATSSRSPLAPAPLGLARSASLPSAIVNAPGHHPTIFAKRVKRIDPGIKPGDAVAVYHEDGGLLGYALANPKAEIRLRMICGPNDFPDDDYWDRRLRSATALRRETLRLDAVADCYRLLHADADGFGGLAVDRYGDVLVAETFSLGMHRRATAILERLAPLTETKHWAIRPAPNTLGTEGYAFPAATSGELPDHVDVQEHGTRYRVPLAGGHKTGFFCDQRENRKRLAELCEGRSVLDLCCYTGGFSVQAKRLGNAGETVGVDLDAEPLELARTNARLNRIGVKYVQADAFGYLRDLAANKRQFDVVVLDPPKLIRSRMELEEGTRKHFDLNRLAFSAVKPGGVLLTCTCAGLLPEEDFLRTVHSAARRALPLEPDGAPGREYRIMAVTGAGADHPTSPRCPETRYLKAAWLCVD